MDFATRLAAAVRRHLGDPGTVANLVRLTGGATKATWSFDARIGDARIPLVLQQSQQPEFAPGDPLARRPRIWGAGDAAILRAAERAGVRIAPVRFALEDGDGLGAGVVTDFVTGETIGQKIIRDPRYVACHPLMAQQCGEILAAIHRIETSPLDFVVPFGATEQLALFSEIFRSYDWPNPSLAFAFEWLRANAPPSRQTTFVHGDFRLGNMIVGEDGVRAVLDWEAGHVGDPMEDLGYLCMRTWRFGGSWPVGGFGTREALFAAYERASGVRVDPARVRYWEAFGNLKWAIICLMKGQQHLRGSTLEMEQLAIGRRADEPIWDFLMLVDDNE